MYCSILKYLQRGKEKMADAFQKFKSSVNRGIATISVKGSSVVEKSKIKTHIDSLNRELEKELMLIGDLAYKIWTNDNSDFSSLNTRFEAIKGKLAEIESLRTELNAIDERDNQILGSNTAQPEVLNEAAKHFCTQCGAQYETLPKFCRKCGNKMSD